MDRRTSAVENSIWRHISGAQSHQHAYKLYEDYRRVAEQSLKSMLCLLIGKKVVLSVCIGSRTCERPCIHLCEILSLSRLRDRCAAEDSNTSISIPAVFIGFTIGAGLFVSRFFRRRPFGRFIVASVLWSIASFRVSFLQFLKAGHQLRLAHLVVVGRLSNLKQRCVPRPLFKKIEHVLCPFQFPFLAGKRYRVSPSVFVRQLARIHKRYGDSPLQVCARLRSSPDRV